MGLMQALTRLDARVVPRLARGLHHVGSRLTKRRTGAGPQRPRLLVVVAVVAVAAVLATVLWQALDEPPRALPSTSTTRVGVRDGDLISAYVDASRTELAQLAASDPRPVLALVSLSDYLAPQPLADLIASADGAIAVVAVYARVPLPRRQTGLVRLSAQDLPDDVVAGMAVVARDRQREADTYARMARDETNDELKALYESNAAVAAAEANAYRRACSCVYALVVRATPAVLSDLAKQQGVRVVDPAPEVADVSSAVFVAPLPEQRDRVVPPPDDALPEPGQGDD